MKYNKKLRFDLFRLYVPNEDRGARSFILVKGKNLYKTINPIIKEILNKNVRGINSLSKILADKLNINLTTVLKMLRYSSKGRWVSIAVLESLLLVWKETCNKSNLDLLKARLDLQMKFDILGSGSKHVIEVKVVRYLDQNLAKIAGAHLADGNLKKEKTRNGFSYKLSIVDHYKSNLDAFAMWLKKVFGINVSIKKLRIDAWEINLRNKIIGRYFELFLGFPCGKKTYHNLPEIIRNAPKKLKRCFIIGLMSFDGCVETDKTVSYGIVNSTLRDQIVNILFNDFKLKVKSQDKKGFFHFRTGVLSHEEGKKWMMFFEPNTEKWFKLKDFIKGFSNKANSFDEAMSVLGSVYEKQNSSKITIEDVILALKELKTCDKYILANKLGIGVSTLYRYIHILEKASILKRTKNPKEFNISNFHETYVRVYLKKKFIEELFTKLKEKNYTQEKLSLILKVSESSINNWVRSRHNIPLYRLKKILRLSDLKLSNSDILRFNRLVFTYNTKVKEWNLPSRNYYKKVQF